MSLYRKIFWNSARDVSNGLKEENGHAKDVDGDSAAFAFARFWAVRQTSAQETDAQQDAVRKLQDRMDQLRIQMTEIQSELDALHGEKLPHTGAIETTPPPPPPPQPKLTLEQEEQAAGEATRRHRTFGEDEEDAPRLYNAPLEIDEPGFFHLPGTQTMLKLDGSIRTDFLYDPTVSDLPDSFITSSIPIPHVSGPSGFNTGIRGSRFRHRRPEPGCST